jgi:hypothetical protein
LPLTRRLLLPLPFHHDYYIQSINTTAILLKPSSFIHPFVVTLN